MKSAIALAGVCLAAAPAFGLSSHTFVANNGTNNATCSQSAPCDTFAHALAATGSGGLIDALNVGDYGPVLIAQSVTINGHGMATIGTAQSFAGCTSTAAAICLNTGASITVTIRDLSIDTLGNAIIVTPGTPATLALQGIEASAPGNNCVLAYLGSLVVRDSIFANCSTALYIAVNAMLENVTIENALTGIATLTSLGPNYSVTVRNSNISQNTNGLTLQSGGTTVTLESVMVSNNSVGITSNSAGGVAQLSNTTITGNATGISVSGGGAVISFVNNRIYGNTTNGAATQSVYQK